MRAARSVWGGWVAFWRGGWGRGVDGAGAPQAPDYWAVDLDLRRAERGDHLVDVDLAIGVGVENVEEAFDARAVLHPHGALEEPRELLEVHQLVLRGAVVGGRGATRRGGAFRCAAPEGRPCRSAPSRLLQRRTSDTSMSWKICGGGGRRAMTSAAGVGRGGGGAAQHTAAARQPAARTCSSERPPGRSSFLSNSMAAKPWMSATSLVPSSPPGSGAAPPSSANAPAKRGIRCPLEVRK